MSSRCGQMPPADSNAPVLRFLQPVLVTGLFALAACNTTGEVYRQGPWGSSPYSDVKPPEYSSPWNSPRFEVLSEQPVPTTVYKVYSEPMEPTGAWASKDVAVTPPNGGNGAEEFARQQAPLPQASIHASAQPPVIGSLAPSPSAEPKTQSPARSPSSLTGHWTARDAGSSCRLQLSSTPSLDLYRASTSQCTSRFLQSVNAWSYRDDMLVLYSRGKVVLRLQGDGPAFTGTAEGQRSPITVTR